MDIIKENGFTFKNARSRWHPAETMTDVEYVDNLALLTDTPAQAQPQLHSLEQAAWGIGLYVNANKTELICFKQEGVISILSAKFLKLVDQVAYLSSNI